MQITTLTIEKSGAIYQVDNLCRPGMPPIGRGQTLKEAIGDWVINNQAELGIRFDTSAVQDTVTEFKASELATR